MLLYDVAYPGGRSCDSAIPLSSAAPVEGAVATCINGPRVSYTYQAGDWRQIEALPQFAWRHPNPVSTNPQPIFDLIQAAKEES